MADQKRARQTSADHKFDEQGQGGEYHQHAADGSERLTTAQGVSISDN